MFARYRFSVPLIGISLLYTPYAISEVRNIIGACDRTGECATTFDRSDAITRKICPKGTLISAWHNGSRPILLQCQSSGTSEENKTYILQGENIAELNYGRYISLSYIKNHPTESIQDKYTNTPLCAPAEENRLRTAHFILLKKQPNQRNDDYCYEITYVTTNDHGLSLFNNSTLVDSSNRDYFLPPPNPRTQENIKEIIHQLDLWKKQQESLLNH